MTKEIRSILSIINNVVSAWGFGSFFRGSPTANDADIVIVVDSGDLQLQLISWVRHRLDRVQMSHGLAVHATILTIGEFAERPLLEMDSLVPLYERSF